MTTKDLHDFSRMAAEIAASMERQALALRMLADQVAKLTDDMQRRVDDHEIRIARLESRRAR